MFKTIITENMFYRIKFYGKMKNLKNKKFNGILIFLKTFEKKNPIELDVKQNILHFYS